ncbi:hypothetical protein AKJ08_3610 [Vulgatibacter incomptus]|uniref:DUF4365 domain-containing protein n=2 Tax=Vulgatibacter incomptus TaxID=1391653 RepID=A0A0K1PI63_9BACT|nr:hypothetical protein AKJ08_3610 [Vulgatibacter incomptus]
MGGALPSNPADMIGAVGESFFGLLLDRAGIVWNRVQRDRAGWDFVCHLTSQTGEPCSGQAITLANAISPSLSVLFQVKASENLRVHPPRVKLSNLRHFLDWPNPAFFALLDFHGSDAPTSCHLIHFDKHWVEKTIKRFWDLEPDQVNSLHKRSLVLPISEAVEVALEPNGLSHTLFDLIGEAKDYSARKDLWRKEAGNKRFSMTFKTEQRNEKDPDRMVDLAIGLTENLPSELTDFSEIRFGNPRPISIFHDRDVLVSLPDLKPTAKAFVDFSNEDRSSFVRYAADFFHPHSVFPFLPFESLRLRLRGAFLDVIITPSASALSLTFERPSSSTLVSLASLGSSAKALQIVGECGRLSKAMSITVHLDDGTRTVFPIVPPAGIFPAAAVDEASLIANAHDLARAIGLPSDLELCISDLWDSRKSIELCCIVLCITRSSDVGITSLVDPDFTIDGHVGLATVAECKIGDYVIICSGAIYGSPQASDGPTTGTKLLKVAGPVVEKTFQTTINWPTDPSLIFNARSLAKAAAVDRLNERGVTILLDSTTP